eukprot:933891-Rhodomonas_salina.2
MVPANPSSTRQSQFEPLWSSRGPQLGSALLSNRKSSTLHLSTESAAEFETVLVPSGQFWHAALPAVSLYFPLEHGVQSCPVPVYPALQVQSSRESLNRAEAVPSGH